VLWNQQVAQQGSPAAAAKISAPPGYSEHHTGYAIDLGTDPNTDLQSSFQTTAAYTWLQQNASTYGFQQSFTGAANQGADNEPWHFRYQGTPQAKSLFAQANAPNAVVQQSGGCSGDYGGTCIASDGKTSATYKGVNIADFKNAIASVESLGSGGYSAIGIWVDDGAGNQGRGLGKYQFMSYGPAKGIIASKPGGQAFLNAVNSQSINTSTIGAQLPQFLTAQEQESLMDNQIKHLVDVGMAQGLTGDALIRRMAEMHEGGEGVRPSVDGTYSDSVVADYKQGGKACVQGSGVSTGTLKAPVSGPITSPYGWRIHPVTGEQSFHSGVDFGVDMGTSIQAADGGKITFAGWDDGGCGEMTIIDHGGGLTTTYCHQSKLNVAVGQNVSKGQTIGQVGSTGRSTGPHLHFTVRKNGQTVDPMSYLQK
jgi:Peptidase family M23/D-alanyl-D-alanine carboxypeptidase